MTAYLVCSWRASDGNVEWMTAAIESTVEHCRLDHPLIADLVVLSADAEGARDYTWIERFESEEELRADPYTDECDALWAPLKERAVPGSFAARLHTAAGAFSR